MGYKVRFYKEKHIIHLQGGSSVEKNVVSSKLFLDSYNYYNQIIGRNFERIVKKQIRRYRFESTIIKCFNQEKAKRYMQIAGDWEKYIGEELNNNG